MEDKMDKTIFDLQLPPAIDSPRWAKLERSLSPNRNKVSIHKRIIAAAWRDLNLRKGSRVLEVGGGLGLISMGLANKGADVTCLDIYHEDVVLLNYVAGYHGLGVRAICGDSCFLPFKDEEFDAVFSKSTFEHIHDQKTALDEQLRVLKKGGRIMIMDGNLLNPVTLRNLLFVRPKTSKGRQGGFRWLFTKGRIYKSYGKGWLGKDEDVKTLWWWRRILGKYSNIKLVRITTSRCYFYPRNVIYRIFKPFAGMIVVVIEKRG